MNFFVLLSLLATVGTFREVPPASAPPGQAHLVAQVESRFAELVEVAKTLDVERYMRFFDPPRFSGISADGTVMHSLEAFEEEYRQISSQIERYVSLEFRNVKVTLIDGQTAVLVNEYDAKVKLKTGQEVEGTGAGSQVWSRTDGEWLLVSVSSSSIDQ